MPDSQRAGSCQHACNVGLISCEQNNSLHVSMSLHMPIHFLGWGAARDRTLSHVWHKVTMGNIFNFGGCNRHGHVKHTLIDVY